MQTSNAVIENLFRNEYGKILAVLVSKFGPAHLETVEDAVQDALVKAMQLWGYQQMPENPTAWLLRVANNRIIDLFRKNNRMTHGAKETLAKEEKEEQELHLENRITDSQLKMIFACCHPSLSADAQLILSLKLIGGFGNKEIAKALLKKEDAVAKSFTRAKKKLKEEITSLEIPVELGLQSRLFVVLRVIYLLFSEGYAATSGKAIIKRDICYEAIRLALLLKENKYCRHPNLDALIGLMCFHTSRFNARLAENGELIDLEHQDRSLYNRELIRIGVSHLEQSGTAYQTPSKYHLEAAVSYYHCTAKNFESTDWKSILTLYELHLKQQYSPIVELNSMVPYFKIYGAEKGLEHLKRYAQGPHAVKNSLYHAIKATMLSETEKKAEAIAQFGQAIELSQNELEKKHFLKKMQQLTTAAN